MSYRNSNSDRMSLGSHTTATQVTSNMASTAAFAHCHGRYFVTGTWKMWTLVYDGTLADADKVKIYQGSTRVDNSGSSITFATTTALATNIKIGTRTTTTDFPLLETSSVHAATSPTPLRRVGGVVCGLRAAQHGGLHDSSPGGGPAGNQYGHS